MELKLTDKTSIVLVLSIVFIFVFTIDKSLAILLAKLLINSLCHSMIL